MAWWLVTIGEDCRIAPRVYILAHDSSMKTHLGDTRLEPTVIDDRVFVGAAAIAQCGLTIGSDAIMEPAVSSRRTFRTTQSSRATRTG